MNIEIDSGSGFCFGVVTAINKAEAELASDKSLYCLGDIVHNSSEVERLRKKGLVTITHTQLAQLHNAKVLLRAHGEPPQTYNIAKEQNIEIIDATCPVVLRLQQRIKALYDSTDPKARPQIVIYGKNGHAEVNGLVGQTEGNAIVIENEADLDALDFAKPIALYSQTTKSLEGFRHIIDEIRKRMKAGVDFQYFDTICRQVANRVENLKSFAASKDVVIFVAGSKSSNGKILFEHCLSVNPKTHLVADQNEINTSWFEGASSVGICGATSTPRWLMEEIKTTIDNLSF